MRINGYSFNGTGAVGASSVRSRARTKKKKKLSYSYTELSNAILLTRDSAGAGRVLIRARSRAAVLRQQLVSGEYELTEVRSAIAHADAMARVARKRMKHFRDEERAARMLKSEGGGGPGQECAVWDRTTDRREEIPEDSLEEMPEKISEESLEKILEDSLEEMPEENLEEMLEACLEESLWEAMDDTVEEMFGEVTGTVGRTDPKGLERIKKKHRLAEQKEVLEADMKYLKALFDRLAREKQGADSGVCALLSLGGTDLPVEAAPVEVPAEGGVDVQV